MPIGRQTPQAALATSFVWPSGGRHLWPSGAASTVQSHERGHLVYAATGVLTVHTDRGTSVVPANRVAWTPAGSTHWHRAHGDTDMRIAFLSPSLAGRLPDRPAVFLATGLAREVLLSLTATHSDGRAAPDYRGPARARLLRVLVDELSEAREQPLYLPQPRDDRLRAVAHMLSKKPDDNTSMADLGRAIGASSRTLSRLLRNEFGMTFHEWRTHLRIYHALVLLAEGHDVTQTAYACGWANPSGFITAFATIVGTTPGRYQAGYRSAARGR
jgi:AraC-like DNA-binding protein